LAACVLRGAVCLAAAAAVGGEEGQVLPPLVSIRDVLADVNAPARRQVMVRGVVIWRVGSGLIMQDESGGIWVDTFRDAPQPIAHECDPAMLERLAPGLHGRGHGRNVFWESAKVRKNPNKASKSSRFWSAPPHVVQATCLGGAAARTRTQPYARRR
jgi:hypothetical protein